MSLFTPVFPSFHESNTSRKGPPENTLTVGPEKQECYVDFLRDLHIFLSKQSDVLSPPSRPGSPVLDHRVQKLRDQIQTVFNATEGDTSSGKWTRVSQTLKLGCVRGRHWSVDRVASCAPEEDTTWILPEQESEWFEWEKRREENRRFKGKTNVAQQLGTTTSATPSSHEGHRASSVRPYNVAREQRLRAVSPTTLRTAKEKVRKWQVSVASEACHDSTRTTSPLSTTADVEKIVIEKPHRSRTLDFAVVKPAARSIIGKRGKAPLSRPGIRGGSAPMPSRKSKSSTPSGAGDAPRVQMPINLDATGSKQPPTSSPVKGDSPKIADIPETPYLPPSFPVHLKTSTPLPDSAPDSALVIRAKPSPILPIPASSLVPPPSLSATPPNESKLIVAELHAANVSSRLLSQPPQIDTFKPGKRARSPSASLDQKPNDRSATPPVKRLRSQSRNCSTPPDRFFKPMSPKRGLDMVPYPLGGARDPSPGSAPSNPHGVDTVGMASGVPLTPGKNVQPLTGTEVHNFPEKIPSPTKSVKSYFSAPDSDHDDSPLKANLLLESPVSPMLSYAQNASGFLPQITSTQVGKGSPSADRTSNGFGMGFSSQFDVERHVDRVSELLEKDVDLDGWMRDVRTMEMSQD